MGNVKLCFATGTSLIDLKHRLADLKLTNPKLANMFECAVTCDGFVLASNMDTVQPIEYSNPDRNKSDAISEIIDNIGSINASGFIFMGDSRAGLMGMEYLKMLSDRFEYGTYNIMPKSSEVQAPIPYVDFRSTKPRIEGCVERLNFVTNKIIEKENLM